VERSSENLSQELPADVVSAIQANRKIEAIKLLRAATGMGLKEAKHAVEAYARANPNPTNPMPLEPESSGNKIALIAFALFAGYVLYQILN